VSAADVEAYLAAQPAGFQASLRTLRGKLLTLLPGAEERISYGMPGLRHRGRMVAGYAGFTRHMGFYPHSGSVVPAFGPELTRLGLRFTRSGVLFTCQHPLPDDLLARLVAARLAELD
jgi:uncharacterized protein YdhG (YjbR/CyaY superfamily)